MGDIEGEVIAMEIGFLEQMLGFRLKQAHFLLLKGGEERLADLGITPPGFTILAVLSQNPGQIQSRLVDNLYLTRSTCSELVEQLIQSKLLRREPIDRRSNGLFITKSGEKTLSKARKRIENHTQKMTAHLSPTEIETLVQLLARLSSPKGNLY